MTATTMDVRKMLSTISEMYLFVPTREHISRWRTALSDEQPGCVQPLQDAVETFGLMSDAEIEELQTEYTRLFVGPAALPCPPWESMYRSPDRLMLQESYDALVALQAEAGLAMKQKGILADHIGAELHFLVLLLDRIEGGQEQERASALALADRLLDDHLNKWTASFTRDLERAAAAPLYRALGPATREVLAALQE